MHYYSYRVSGSVDASGKITEVGQGDPIADVADIEERTDNVVS